MRRAAKGTKRVGEKGEKNKLPRIAFPVDFRFHPFYPRIVIEEEIMLKCRTCRFGRL